ncbi:iron chelate uptake ABC transporter family permease subunit [Aneurinibacillus aneurinilyticus]|uniref:Iron chelate uptake ABC transporter, FeCT family, permease protein n=1 Tax=Aneurinibacillus aneurinilyticus ATCC 12856 TaxID=649747 RepID=U1Y740_ANEAE|nr:iron chelate uptake ABC transporter family permease subunit [Aneurinibacillus aneurinilyticus]ERI06686.1 iron chelate uptake ABC transporter, FeCT family, permease protein [Aneurinibacillus aneurinilyticus ATCC 12856]MED0705539.1 iron chelate uptake ABC transporter family permease subunit [Aneurinibacillus aneurinilyticus]MED0723139.1 iron chelate uptake ABC transporter family permease subunit [Aneurinibacillus aneurinilyticus]MED0731574.1 iron chelate uptake ABC transporter family permease 
MKHNAKIGALAAFSVLLIAIFLFIKVGNNWDYVLPRRGLKVLAIVITGSAIAFSTVVFQTITNNRILTPSIMGLDSLYMLIQTFVIFIFGSTNLTVANKNINFVICVGLMVLFSGVLYKVLFKREGQNIYFLLLMGLILGTLFQSLSTFMQVLIDPNEFQIVQDKMFASFNNVNTDLLLIAIIAILGIAIYFSRFIKYLDVLSLGRDQAINLGVDYDYVVKRLLIVIAIFVSISTALVGPITFLGLLVVNVAHEFLKTYQHKYLIFGSVFISIIALVGGQLIVERVFTFSTTLSVIINFIGGVYFIYLLLRERKSW